MKKLIGRSTRRRPPRLCKQSGIALLMIIFTVTLLSIMGIALTQSTYIGSQLHRSFVDRFRAELILRSVLNVALQIIAQDKRDTDPPKDSWGPFVEGQVVPAQLLGVNDPNVEIGLEISAEASKIPLLRIMPSPGNTRDKDWRDILTRLFELLGFDNDGETDQTGLFADRSFSSREMVANLIDYMDAETTSYSEDNYNGIEADLPEGYFPAEGKKEFTLLDLTAIPGFTPNRMRLLSPFVTPLSEFFTVNINLASPDVLRAIDPTMTEDGARAIYDFAHSPDGPFPQQGSAGASVLSANFPNYQKLRDESIVNVESNVLQVIAKVQFGDRRFFLRALVVRRNAGSTEPPDVTSQEFFG